MIDKFAEMTFHSALRSWLLPEIIYNQKEIKSGLRSENRCKTSKIAI